MLQVGHAERGLFQILEQGNQISNVLRTVVQRRRRYQDDFLFSTQSIRHRSQCRRLADALQFVESVRSVVAEFVRLVDDDEIVFFRVLDLVQAAIGHDFAVIQPKFLRRRVPAVRERGWNHNQGVRTVLRETILEEEFLGDKGSNDGFAEPDHVSQEETVVLFQQPISGVDGINLISQSHEAFRQVTDGIRVIVDACAEVLE